MAASPGHKTNGEASLPQDLLGLVFTKLDMQELWVQRLMAAHITCQRAPSAAAASQRRSCASA